MKLGVVLFQLGGPDSIQAIEPFLYNLFCDPDIIDFPFARIARQPLARLIASRRAKHVAHHYADIGGKSPILEFTTRQAVALERALREEFDARVVIAMRYWNPLTADAIQEMEKHAPDELVLLPLYPQYSKTTTGSSLNEWTRRFRANGSWRPRVHVVEEFYEDPAYIESVVEAIDGALRGFTDPAAVDFVFSAHSVPVAVIDGGDPYQKQIERTTELVWQRGGWLGPAASLLSEQGRRLEVARAIDAPDGKGPCRRGGKKRPGRTDLVRLRPRRDAARNRHRASRAGALPRHFELPDGPRPQRYGAVHPGPDRAGSGAPRGPGSRVPAARRLRLIHPATDTTLPTTHTATSPSRTPCTTPDSAHSRIRLP